MIKKLKLYLNYLTMGVSFVVPKKNNRWVFGAWFGDRVSDNPYAFYEYVKENHPEIETIWISNKISHSDSVVPSTIKRNSIKGIWKCLTAEVAVMNQCYLDFANYNWISNSYKVQLWHGVPWKKIGEDTPDPKSGILHRISHKTFMLASKCDHYISSSDITKEALLSAFATTAEKIQLVGQPRNEILMDEERCAQARKAVCKNIGDIKKIVLYMPTFRDNTTEAFSFSEIYDRIEPLLLKHDAIILEKQHYVSSERDEGTHPKNRIMNAEEYDSQKLLAAADILVTDYSSCFFDYVLRDKPIIHYLYDYDSYKNTDRGLYYDLDYVKAGDVAYTEDELIKALANNLDKEDINSERRKLIKNRFLRYEDKDNSERIFNAIMSSKKVK